MNTQLLKDMPQQSICPVPVVPVLLLPTNSTGTSTSTSCECEGHTMNDQDHGTCTGPNTLRSMQMRVQESLYDISTSRRDLKISYAESKGCKKIQNPKPRIVWILEFGIWMTTGPEAANK